MHLILFTGLLQVTLATVDAGNGNAFKSASNGDGNVGLVSLGNMNTAHFAKQSASEKCPVEDIEKRCAKKAEDTAKINGYDDPEQLIRKLASLINDTSTETDGCEDLKNGKNITTNPIRYCPQMLEIAKCELAAGCSTCNENEEKNIENLFQTWFSQTNCSEVDGINKTAFHVDCSKATTKKPDPTKPTDKPDPSKSTSKPNPNRSTKSAKTSSSTSGSKTVIIVVSVVAVILLIIAGGITAYCCLCSGKGQKKNAAGKLQIGQKMAVKGGVLSSKMGNSDKSGLGKSSSSKRGGAAVLPSKSQIGAAPSNSQSGVGGPKVSSNSQMGVSKSKV
ncbi:hypothetical protein TYRP_009178 [Tyrophagus putrescentiae]|nr:hypothetical protein TYRP_009178 [Tyrophagus putrescentiae]